jgi:Rab GDP dissociation inhibitor
MSKFFDSEDGKGAEGKIEKNFSWMPAGCEPLADGEYDAIIMGTGLTECIISGLLSVNGKRVLHVDRNNYYGADTASLSLLNLFQKFRGEATPGANLGHSRGTFKSVDIGFHVYL